MNRNFAKDALLGVSVGDAIGVPVEFQPRIYLQNNPVAGVQGYGSHNQPPGTWSDDSSLTFCLAEMLAMQYDLDDLATRFIGWKAKGYWTPHGQVFDIGNATSEAIGRLERGVSPTMAGGRDDYSNGNGSLMRILPLVFYVKDMDINTRWPIVSDVSSLTHRHIRSVLSCFIYIEVAIRLIEGMDKRAAYQEACAVVKGYLRDSGRCSDAELQYFANTLSGSIFTLLAEEIRSSGYVIHTLEASLWSFLTTDNYRDAVLRAVNLGEDTDTTGAVTGGLAAIYYGSETIPADWLQALIRKADIEELSERLHKKFQ